MVGVSDSSMEVAFQSLEAMSKLWHVLSGLYIWEFLTTLDYEWSVIRRRRPYRWTIWIYSLTRTGTFVACILLFVCLDFMTPVVCQFVPIAHFTMAYLCFGAASSLILLRVIAVWNKNKVMSWLATGLWITNVAFLIQGVVRLRFVWLPSQACVVRSIDSFKLSLIVTLITDIALLLMVLVGLLRLRCPGDCSPLGRLLWDQSILWLLFAIIGEVPPVVFVLLNINKALDLTFQLPSLIIMTIAASRTHRALAEYTAETTHIASSGFRTGNPPKLKTKRTTAVQVTTMEVSVQMAHEQYPASHSSSDIDIDIDEKQDEKLNGLTTIDRDDDLESGVA